MDKIEHIKGTFDRQTPPRRTDISAAVIRRLPRYHRYLSELLRCDRLRISSSELSRMMGVTASQIRQDLNCFGGFGQQGYGYNVKYLHGKISELLGINAGYRAVIIGAGNLGRALAASHMFERRGVTRLAMFDVSPTLIGTTWAELPVLDVACLEDFCREQAVEIAVLTTPKESAEEVARRAAAAGVRGIWNFSNMELRLQGSSVLIQNMHIGDSLMTLCYELFSREAGEEDS